VIVGGPSINHNSSSKKTHLAGPDQILEQLSQIDRLVVVLLLRKSTEVGRRCCSSNHWDLPGILSKLSSAAVFLQSEQTQAALRHCCDCVRPRFLVRTRMFGFQETPSLSSSIYSGFLFPFLLHKSNHLSAEY